MQGCPSTTACGFVVDSLGWSYLLIATGLVWGLVISALAGGFGRRKEREAVGSRH